MPDKRLIDANALVDKVSLDWGLTHQNQLISATTKLATADAMCKLLGEAAKCQTIDAVEVVRCKDCKYRGYDDCPMCHDEYYYDEEDGGDWVTRDMTVDDGFCHKGAKMDGGTEC